MSLPLIYAISRMRRRDRAGKRPSTPFVPFAAPEDHCLFTALSRDAAALANYIGLADSARPKEPMTHTEIRPDAVEVSDKSDHSIAGSIGTGHGQLRGPTLAQADMAFNAIASNANLLVELLTRLRQQPAHNYDQNATFADLCLAATVANQIGALADEMSGGQVRGTLASWVIGTRFDDP